VKKRHTAIRLKGAARERLCFSPNNVMESIPDEEAIVIGGRRPRSRIDRGIIRELVMKVEERARSIGSECGSSTTCERAPPIVEVRKKRRVVKLKDSEREEGFSDFSRTLTVSNCKGKRLLEENNEPPLFLL